MAYSQYTPQEVEARGEAIYQANIRGTVQVDHEGEFVVIDIETGDYEIDADDLAATQRLLAKRPEAVLYGLRIGHPVAYQLGAGIA
jgi:hypothetical protein